jgi:hypothetical protein
MADVRQPSATAPDGAPADSRAGRAIHSGVSRRTVLRAPGGICGMHATQGWQDEAVRITAILFEGLRYGAHNPG